MIRGGAGFVALCLASAVSASPLTDPAVRDAGAATTVLDFRDLAGWDRDDHAAALATFRRSCARLLAGKVASRPAVPPPSSLIAACAQVIHVKQGGERAFFERLFEPVLMTTPASATGFLTGYFEPVYPGSRMATSTYTVPLLGRPADLVTLDPGEAVPDRPELRAARRTEDGLAPYPDRAAIEDGALGDLSQPVVWLRSAAQAFIIHVQGSARIRLPDGSSMRVGYAGRNGHPFTAIGRVLVERGEVALAQMNLETLMGWLEANPEPARDLMRLNRSYIFFREVEGLAEADGPFGGEGTALTPGRSLAVDRTIWPYGLPVWLEGHLPRSDGGAEPMARLMIAQDTGSAIVGPMRGDFFWGTGAEAGTRAGLTRQSVRFVILRPRE